MNSDKTYIVAASGGWERQARLYRQWETHIGTPEAIEELRQSMPIGILVDGKGTVYGIRGGIDKTSNLPTLTVNYQTRRDAAGNPVNPATSTTPDSHQLSGSLMQLPISHHTNYLMNWNHYLITRDPDNTVPSWWATAKDGSIAESLQSIYRWIKNVSEIPTQPQDGLYWHVLQSPQKPGIEVYDWAVYTITETGHHATEAQAAWAIGKLNTITTPLLDDFGVSEALGGNWKLQSVNLDWQDGLFVATRTYELSGDANGWDTDIYYASS